MASQYLVTLKAPAVVEGGVIVEAESVEDAKKKAMEKVASVIWSRSSTDEKMAEASRVVLITP